LNNKLTHIDLYAGVGGFTFEAAERFETRLLVDSDESARTTLKRNRPRVPYWRKDLSEVPASKLMDLARLSPGELDVLTAGVDHGDRHPRNDPQVSADGYEFLPAGGARPEPPSGPAEPVAPAPAPAGSASGDWSGGAGYTVVLASLSSESAARGQQARATAAGLDAGVLFSSRFRSLRPGYWVVFSGVFGAQADAARRAAHAKELGYAQAYPRYVAP
jgi:SPOR domain